MNWYCTLDDVKARLKIPAASTSSDADLALLIEEVSREMDKECGRHFFVKSASKIYDVSEDGARFGVMVDDLLSVSAVGIDTENDNTFDGDTLTEGTHYVLTPDNVYPKWKLKMLPLSAKSLTVGERKIRITGQWGYGDEYRADPVTNLGITGTLSDAADTTMSVNTADVAKVGMTLRLENEQVFVTAAPAGSMTVTVRRGMNGTTAVAHTTAAVYRYDYPPLLQKFCKVFCDTAWQARTASGIYQRKIGNYSEMFHLPGQAEQATKRMVGLFKRRTFGRVAAIA